VKHMFYTVSLRIKGYARFEFLKTSLFHSLNKGGFLEQEQFESALFLCFFTER
jgi:hypothetical protein